MHSRLVYPPHPPQQFSYNTKPFYPPSLLLAQANLARGCERAGVDPSKLHRDAQLHQLLEPLRPGTWHNWPTRTLSLAICRRAVKVDRAVRALRILFLDAMREGRRLIRVASVLKNPFEISTATFRAKLTVTFFHKRTIRVANEVPVFIGARLCCQS